jgi:predicted O-linked N-acetylglucosamine transferase (SPINDLY family)
MFVNWHSQAEKLLQDGNFSQLVEYYETLVETEPENCHHYCYLGLAYLLNEQEDEAQTSWFFILSQVSEDETSYWLQEISRILERGVNDQINCGNTRKAWLIAHHLREVNPANIHLTQLSIELNEFEPQQLDDWNFSTILTQSSSSDIDEESVLKLLNQILSYPSEAALTFTRACIRFVNCNHQRIEAFVRKSLEIGEEHENPGFAADLIGILLSTDADNIEFLKLFCRFSISARRYPIAIEAARKYCEISQTLNDKFLSNYQLLRVLALSGSWLEIAEVVQRHRDLSEQLFSTPQNLSYEMRHSLIPAASFWAYLQDNLPENRYFLNQVGHLFTPKTPIYSFPKNVGTTFKQSTRRLKIGYLAHTLRQHSVGWLSRWLFQYHDRELFHTSIYLVNRNLEDDFYSLWFANNVDEAHSFNIDAQEIASSIYQDEIDILVDLDSSTLNVSYEVMARKPSPVQVTWLGWDASGLSAVDYFIADPYVLTEEAQTHYQENIWRLPQTYIAVDGFEVGIPTLRREDINIPLEAILFQSSQAGAKRHPETIRLQMKILKEVPNSYFLIKALGDSQIVQDMFIRLAEQEGVSPERLRFSGIDPSEYVHRANLQIADVVLDTYPYNGATTTLETLWMCIPLVTRVGQTFSSRNSYTFLKNVGISEGIAWTDEEYIEWGIRLGTDEKLRQNVAWKLRQSRKTSPLWNAKQFTRDLENAYQSMWTNYLAQQ